MFTRIPQVYIQRDLLFTVFTLNCWRISRSIEMSHTLTHTQMTSSRVTDLGCTRKQTQKKTKIIPKVADRRRSISFYGLHWGTTSTRSGKLMMASVSTADAYDASSRNKKVSKKIVFIFFSAFFFSIVVNFPTPLNRERTERRNLNFFTKKNHLYYSLCGRLCKWLPYEWMMACCLMCHVVPHNSVTRSSSESAPICRLPI